MPQRPAPPACATRAACPPLWLRWLRPERLGESSGCCQAGGKCALLPSRVPRCVARHMLFLGASGASTAVATAMGTAMAMVTATATLTVMTAQDSFRSSALPAKRGLKISYAATSPLRTGSW